MKGKYHGNLGGSLLFLMFLFVLIAETTSAIDVYWAFKEFIKTLVPNFGNTDNIDRSFRAAANTYLVVGVLCMGSYFASIYSSIKILLIILRKQRNGHIIISRLLIEWFIIVKAAVSFLGFVMANLQLGRSMLSIQREMISNMVLEDILDSIMYIAVFVVYLNVSKGVRRYFSASASAETEHESDYNVSMYSKDDVL